MSEKNTFPYLVLLPTKLLINKDCETPPHPDLVDLKLEDRKGRNLLYKIIEKKHTLEDLETHLNCFIFFQTLAFGFHFQEPPVLHLMRLHKSSYYFLGYAQ